MGTLRRCLQQVELNDWPLLRTDSSRGDQFKAGHPKINAWVGLQDELSDRATLLSVGDLDAVEQINVTYCPTVRAIMKW